MVKKGVGGAKENIIDIGGLPLTTHTTKWGHNLAAWQPVERVMWPTSENRAALGAASRCNPKAGGDRLTAAPHKLH